MKILIYCQPRTRSSFLLDILCKHYNLKNYYEPYSDLLNPSYHKTFNKSPDNVFQKYKQNGKEITERLKNTENFGVKLFAVCCYNYYKFAGIAARNSAIFPDKHTGTINEKSIIGDPPLEKKDLINVIDHYNLDMYDKIYVLYRDEVEKLASNYHATYHERFIYRTEDIGFLKLYNTENKSLPTIQEWKLKARILETVIFKYNVELLKKKYNNLVMLDYKDIPNYVKENYPNIVSEHQETNFDYKSLKKYDQLEELIKQYEKELKVDELLETLLSN